jgi:hypothetical protein
MAGRTISISGFRDINETESSKTGAAAGIQRSLGSLLLSVVEAICVFYISFAKLGITAASVSLSTSSAVAFIHQDMFRLPLLAIAFATALMNLYLLWHARRLRNTPSAAWRRRPLSRAQRTRTAIVVTLSLLTVALTVSEVWIHRALHHTTL